MPNNLGSCKQRVLRCVMYLRKGQTLLSFLLERGCGLSKRVQLWNLLLWTTSLEDGVKSQRREGWDAVSFRNRSNNAPIASLSFFSISNLWFHKVKANDWHRRPISWRKCKQGAGFQVCLTYTRDITKILVHIHGVLLYQWLQHVFQCSGILEKAISGLHASSTKPLNTEARETEKSLKWIFHTVILRYVNLKLCL